MEVRVQGEVSRVDLEMGWEGTRLEGKVQEDLKLVVKGRGAVLMRLDLGVQGWVKGSELPQLDLGLVAEVKFPGREAQR